MDNFLPEGYQKPASNTKYLKLAEGENKFRILSSAITGYLDWTPDKKPVRTKEQLKPITAGKPAKHFWAFVVFDYKDQTIKILEITQATIQNDIYNYHNDADWGLPLNYDLNIKRTGKDMETKYSVIAYPPKPVAPEITQLYSDLKVDLDQLYINGDPFAPAETQEVNQPIDTEIKSEDIPF